MRPALHGIETNLDYLKQILRGTAFRGGWYTTSFLNGFHYAAHTVDVLSPGVQTTVQDYPRTHRLLEYRRATIRADGWSGVPPGQSSGQ